MQEIDRRLLAPEGKPYTKTLMEQEEWDNHGCKNRKEWRAYLNKCMWSEYTPDIKKDCYIGTHESNLTRYRRDKKEVEL